MTDRERRLMEGLIAFGWAVVDPWHVERPDPARDVEWIIYDSGPVCPVCGSSCPDVSRRTDWPPGETYLDPANHLPTCPFAELLRED